MELTTYTISQIVGFIALSIGLYAFQLKNQKLMFATGELSNAFWIVHYLLLGGYSAAFTMIVAIIRTTIVLFLKPQWKLPVLMFATCLVFIGCAVSNEAYWYKYLPFVAAFTYSIALYWNTHFTRSRLLTLLTMCVWLLYGIMIHSFAEIAESSLSLISICIGILRHRPNHILHKPSV